ncbi:hypothetical protein FOXYSP1_17687 [Fusarium oxysporum f. sp. phaseoli]
MGSDIEMSLLGHEIGHHCKRSNFNSNQGKTTSGRSINMPNNLKKCGNTITMP